MSWMDLMTIYALQVGIPVLRERFWAIPLSCSKRREIPQVGKSEEADNLAVTVKEIDVSVVGIV